MVKTRRMVKDELFSKITTIAPLEIEGIVFSFIENKNYPLCWNDVLKTDLYLWFKNYINKGMGSTNKSDAIIKKCFISYIEP